MPIRNITDRPRMPRLGKIRLGIKVQSGRGTEYPKALDHFLCPDEVVEALRDQVPFCDGACKETPGPLELPITFMSEDREAIATQWLRSYKATVGLVCRGNGYTADAVFDREALAKAGGTISQPIPAEMWARHDSKEMVRHDGIDCWGQGYDGQDPCPAYEADKCKRMMFLQFAILQAPGLGVYQLDTSSIYSMLNINGFLDYLASFTQGRIAGIPLKLKLVPQEVTPEGQKKKTVRVLQLTAAFGVAELHEAMQKAPIELALPEPKTDEEEVEEEIPEGFYPEEEAIEAQAREAQAPNAKSPEPEPPAEEQQAEGFDYFLRSAASAARSADVDVEKRSQLYGIMGLPTDEEATKRAIHEEADSLGIPRDKAWRSMARSFADMVALAKKGETWDAARATVDPMGQLKREAEAGRQEGLPLE